MKLGVAVVLTNLLLIGCASTTVVPVSQNQFVLSASAAPACGRTGAMKVAVTMAAVETLRRGYDGFAIGGMMAENNVSVVQTGPTYANTYSNYSMAGNNLSGRSNTYFGGNQTVFTGTHDSDLAVTMFKRSDPAFAQAIDSRQHLGPEWRKIAEQGVNTCME